MTVLHALRSHRPCWNTLSEASNSYGRPRLRRALLPPCSSGRCHLLLCRNYTVRCACRQARHVRNTNSARGGCPGSWKPCGTGTRAFWGCCWAVEQLRIRFLASWRAIRPHYARTPGVPRPGEVQRSIAEGLPTSASKLCGAIPRWTLLRLLRANRLAGFLQSPVARGFWRQRSERLCIRRRQVRYLPTAVETKSSSRRGR